MTIGLAAAAIILDRLAHLHRLRAAALELYGPGQPWDRVRASEVATDVAARLHAQYSAWFRRDLTTALHAAGWRSVKHGNVRLWVAIARKS